LTLQEFFDLLEHLVDAESGGIHDDRPGGLDERSVGAGLIVPVALGDRRLDLVDIAPDSAPRRSARTRAEAVRYSFSSASWNTTDPMSRPSSTPPPRSRAQLRWRSTSSERTRLLAATALTAVVTSRLRMSAVASTPSTNTPRSPTSRSTASANSATRSTSAGSMPRRIAANVTARYIAPVSRYCNPRRAARARATVLLPAPAGPSMAMTRTYQLVPCGSPSL
jgi:hypothetical protein